MDNDASILVELNAALRRQGVWGPRAKRLLQDWREHVDEDTARRLETGAGPDAARAAAWQALGSPNVLAAKAGSELASGSWLGRHPWWGGLVLPLVAWMTLVAAIFALPVWILSLFEDMEALEKTNPASFHVALACWQVIFNWLPWLAAMAWLARIAVRMPGGWKLYWITAIVLTIFASSTWMVVHLPGHGPRSGSLYVMAIGLLGIIIKAVADLLGYGAALGTWSGWFRGLGAHPGPLIQTVIMALGTVAFYGRMSGRYRRAVTSLGAIVLFLIVALVGGGFASL
jgi:hypothetical protein